MLRLEYSGKKIDTMAVDALTLSITRSSAVIILNMYNECCDKCVSVFTKDFDRLRLPNVEK